MSDTAIELLLPEGLYLALRRAAEQKNVSENELAAEAIQSYLARLQPANPMFGSFADEPELIDRVLEQAMHDRENVPYRLSRMDDSEHG